MKISIDEDFSFTRVFLSFFILAELLIHVKVERESSFRPSPERPKRDVSSHEDKDSTTGRISVYGFHERIRRRRGESARGG